jgi:hypothetical protein
LKTTTVNKVGCQLTPPSASYKRLVTWVIRRKSIPKACKFQSLNSLFLKRCGSTLQQTRPARVSQ